MSLCAIARAILSPAVPDPQKCDLFSSSPRHVCRVSNRINYIYLFEMDPRAVSAPLDVFNNVAAETVIYLANLLIYYKVRCEDTEYSVCHRIISGGLVCQVLTTFSSLRHQRGRSAIRTSYRPGWLCRFRARAEERATRYDVRFAVAKRRAC